MVTADGLVTTRPSARTSGSNGSTYVNVSQAAALLGVSRVSIWRWIRDGHLPASRLGHRTVRIRREDLERVLVKGRPAARTIGFQAEPTNASAMRQSENDEGVPRTAWHATSATEHFVQFYETDDFLIDAVADYIGSGLEAGASGIVVATPEHRDGITERLKARGLDVGGVHTHGQYVSLDAAETMARFLVDGMPDPERFGEVIGGLVAQMVDGGRPVRIFGEMVALLALDGNHAAAIRLEELWNNLQRSIAFSLFCAYPMDRLGGESLAELVSDICGTHSHVIPSESYNELTSSDERLRAITVLQQKARTLETEIAERKRAEERLAEALAAERAARAEAEAALRLRDEFLSIAAHELKTPLTTLQGRAQLLLYRLTREGQLDQERVVETMRSIAGQAGKLSRLLNQLLDVSRIETGNLALQTQAADVAALIEQVATAARAANERHEITLDAPDSLEMQVDALRFEQVLTNLLDNAIKYSPGGGAIEVVLAGPLAGAIELSVRDYGLGIDVDRRNQIFERFYQAHGDAHRSGFGLGLYICRQIVEQHGGEIWAEFPADGGTRFVVRLPIETTASPAREHDVETSAAG